MARQGVAIRTSASRRFIPSCARDENESKAGFHKVATTCRDRAALLFEIVNRTTSGGAVAPLPHPSPERGLKGESLPRT
jgi:hypothetical protein